MKDIIMGWAELGESFSIVIFNSLFITNESKSKQMKKYIRL